MPELRSLSDTGIPEYDVMGWVALFAPARLPVPIAQRISDDLRTVLSEQDTVDKLNGLGTIAKSMDPESFGKFLASEVARYKALVKQANLQLG